MKRVLIRSAVLWPLVVGVALAAASQGLKWDASTTYDDGTPIETDKRVVYVIFSSADGKQVGSTVNLSLAKDKLPADGCYYLQAGILNEAGTGVVAGSYSAPTDPYCTKVPTPVQKRVAKPTGFGAS